MPLAPEKSALCAPVWHQEADPRPYVPVLFFFGIAVWRISPLALLAPACVLLAAWLRQKPYPGLVLRIRPIVWFIALWASLHALLQYTGQATATQALSGSLVLVARLVLVFGAGLWLMRAASPHRLALAFTWCLRPFLRAKAWEYALTLTVMIHTMPRAQQILAGARQQVERRCGNLGRVRRLCLVGAVTVRQLMRLSHTQALALVARGMDRAEPWVWSSPPPFQAICMACGLVLGLVLLMVYAPGAL